MSKEYPELLPCPFCGGEASISFEGSGLIGEWWPYVNCDDCGARGPVADDMNDEPAAVTAWNTRHRIDGQEEMRRALEEAVRIIEQEHDAWLDSAICCSGHDCGCRGSSNRDLIVHDLRAALHSPEEKDNG